MITVGAQVVRGASPGKTISACTQGRALSVFGRCRDAHSKATGEPWAGRGRGEYGWSIDRAP